MRCSSELSPVKGVISIERRFFAIQKKIEKPDSYVELPQVAFA